MYERDTILALKNQQPDDDETGEPFPYNEVRVVGPSPINHALTGDWTGPNAVGVIIQPVANYAGNLDEPFGKLVELYDVKTLPEPLVPNVPVVVRSYDSATAAAGKTPEEVFAQEAPGAAPEEGQTRARTAPTLPDVVAPGSASPLDVAKTRGEAGKKATTVKVAKTTDRA